MWYKQANIGSVPPEPGTTAIPSGMVRRFHVTRGSPEAIRSQGLLQSEAKGYEGPKAIYSWPDWKSAKGYSSSAPVVEFYTDPKKLDGPYHQYGNVPPEQILAIHERWHDRFRYCLENEVPTERMRSSGDSDYIRAADELDKIRGATKTANNLKPIPNSVFFRYYCDHCGDAMRAKESDIEKAKISNIPIYCLKCRPTGIPGVSLTKNLNTLEEDPDAFKKNIEANKTAGNEFWRNGYLSHGHGWTHLDSDPHDDRHAKTPPPNPNDAIWVWKNGQLLVETAGEWFAKGNRGYSFTHDDIYGEEFGGSANAMAVKGRFDAAHKTVSIVKTNEQQRLANVLYRMLQQQFPGAKIIEF